MLQCQRPECEPAQERQAVEGLEQLAARHLGGRVVHPRPEAVLDPLRIGRRVARDVRLQRSAERVVVCPFFLGPGKHWTQDIPRLTAEAAQQFPGTRYHVTQTLGIDDLILDLLDKRIRACTGNDYLCETCRGTIRSGEPGIETPAVSGRGH